MILNKMEEFWWQSKEINLRWALEHGTWMDENAKKKVRELFDELVGLTHTVKDIGYNETVEVNERIKQVIYEAASLTWENAVIQI